MPEFLELSIADYKTKAANAWRGGPSGSCGNRLLGFPLKIGAQCGLVVREALGAPLSEGFPLMPAPDMSGDPTRRPISTKEVSGWIKLLLNRRGIDFSGRRLSSHSGKATMLFLFGKVWSRSGGEGNFGWSCIALAISDTVLQGCTRRAAESFVSHAAGYPGGYLCA